MQIVQTVFMQCSDVRKDPKKTLSFAWSIHLLLNYQSHTSSDISFPCLHEPVKTYYPN